MTKFQTVTTKTTTINKTVLSQFQAQDEIGIEGNTLKGVKVVTEGEAKGHGLYLDSLFLSQTVEFGNSNPKGIDVHFTHGNMLQDRLGTFLGVMKNFRRDGNTVRADLSIDDVAMQDQKNHVLGLAAKYPEKLGISIEFKRDSKAESEFINKNTFDKSFKSPDINNSNSFTHARIDRLYGSAIVSEPAANEGLFGEPVTKPQIISNVVNSNNSLEENNKMELERFKKLKEVAKERNDLLVTWFENGVTPEQAELALKDIKIKELEEENKKLKRVGAEPVNFVPAPEVEVKETFNDKAKRIAKEKNIPLHKVMSDLSKAEPDLYAQSQGKK